MDELSQNSDKNWLIRSSTRILGPYTLSEVSQMLATKQISIIDEIRQPENRWSYIRDNRVFLDLVKNLRYEQDNSVENTVTSTFSSQTLSKTDAILNADELTPTPILKPNESMRKQSGLKEITTAKERSSQYGTSTNIKSYGMQNDARLKQAVDKKAKNIQVFIFAATILVVAAMFAFYHFSNKQNSNMNEQYISAALRYKSLGLYEKSLDAYKKIQSLKDLDNEFLFQMAPLLISEERQSLYGRRIIEKAMLNEGHSRDDVTQSYISMALTFMQEGDLKEAENYLLKSLSNNPNNNDSQIDLAIIQIKKGNYDGGLRELDKVMSRQVNSPFIQGVRAIALIEKSKTHYEEEPLRNLARDLKQSVLQDSYLRQELSLLLIRVSQLIKDAKLESEALEIFTNVRPFQSNLFQRSISLDWRILNWDYLEKYCAESFRGVLQHQQKAARAICLMEVGRDEDGQRMLLEAENENLHNPLYTSLQANYYLKNNRFTEAQTLVKSPELRDKKMAKEIQAILCRNNNDVDCASTIYQSLNNLNSQDVFSLEGLAWVASMRSQKAKAYEINKTGMSVEPLYLPLIEQREMLETQ